MAAEQAAGAGHDVVVFDQRRSPGRKLVLAGRGGLNLTHSEPLEAFLERYGPEREYLEPSIRGFTPADLRTWSAGLGQPTFVGSSGRVFPASFRAVPLLRSWLRRLDDLGIRFELGQRWSGWAEGVDPPTPQFVGESDGVEKTVECDACILALGGSSWPGVSSDGSWVDLLRASGVAVTPLRAANCGMAVDWSPVMVERFAGQPIKNAAVVVDGVAIRGDPVITSFGLEGGPIYAHSRRVRDDIDVHGHAEVTIDLLPDLDIGDVVRRLVERRRTKRSISTWLARCGLGPAGISLLREVTENELPTDPDELGELVKTATVIVGSMAPIDRAISSAGGVAWSEVDVDLQLHAIPRTYVVGEMLDWEAPTGGYLLQAVFSTGHRVGSRLGI